MELMNRRASQGEFRTLLGADFFMDCVAGFLFAALGSLVIWLELGVSTQYRVVLTAAVLLVVATILSIIKRKEP